MITTVLAVIGAVTVTCWVLLIAAAVTVQARDVLHRRRDVRAARERYTVEALDLARARLAARRAAELDATAAEHRSWDEVLAFPGTRHGIR